jgi:hypothetical protein
MTEKSKDAPPHKTPRYPPPLTGVRAITPAHSRMHIKAVFLILDNHHFRGHAKRNEFFKGSAQNSDPHGLHRRTSSTKKHLANASAVKFAL